MADAERPASAAWPADAPDPVAAASDAVLIHLPEFEGPLDLLLHLIRKEELEIVNIPVSLITEKYLHYIQMMQALNIDVAGEYLLMAATLAWLKSRELVPPEPGEEDAASGEEDEELGDPRQALIQRLLEYQKYKDAAAKLGARPVMGRNVWGRGAPGEQVATGLVVGRGPSAELEEVPVFKLIESLEEVLKRARVTLTHDVVVERISITDRINALVDRLDREPAFTFASCFDFVDTPLTPAELRHQIVVTFLAVLEMTRLRMVRLHQAAELGEIYVQRADRAAGTPEVVDGEAGPPVSSTSTSASPPDAPPSHEQAEEDDGSPRDV